MKHPETDFLIRHLEELNINDLLKALKESEIIKSELKTKQSKKVQKRTLCQIHTLLLRAQDEIADYEEQKRKIKKANVHSLEELFNKVDIEVNDDIAKLLYGLL